MRRNRASHVAHRTAGIHLQPSLWGAVLMGKTRTRRAGADWGHAQREPHLAAGRSSAPPEIRARESFSQSASSKRDVLWPRQDTKTTTTPDLANEKGDSLHRRTAAAPPAGRRVSPPQQTSRKSHPSGLSPLGPLHKRARPTGRCSVYGAFHREMSPATAKAFLLRRVPTREASLSRGRGLG